MSLEPCNCEPGMRVKVVDKTSCHGKTGTVLRKNASGIIVVELDDGTVWPTFPNEIEAANPEGKDT